MLDLIFMHYSLLGRLVAVINQNDLGLMYFFFLFCIVIFSSFFEMDIEHTIAILYANSVLEIGTILMMLYTRLI